MDQRQFGSIESMQTVGIEERDEPTARIIRSAALQATLVIPYPPPHDTRNQWRNVVLGAIYDDTGYVAFAKAAYAAQKRFKTWEVEGDIISQRAALLLRITGIESRVSDEVAAIARERAAAFDPPAPADLADVLIDQEIRRFIGEQRGEGHPFYEGFSRAKLDRITLASARSPIPSPAEQSASKTWAEAQQAKRPDIVANLAARTEDCEWASLVLTSMRTILDPEAARVAIRARAAQAA